MLYLKLLRRYLSLAIARETQYRANLFALIFVGVVEAFVTVMPMLLLFSFTDSLDGWTRGETIALAGFFRIGLALYAMVADGGIARLSDDINHGHLDLLLMRPVNTQFLVTFRFFSLYQVVSMMIGGIIIATGIAESGVAITLESLLKTTVILACGVALVTVAISAGAYIAFRATTVEELPWAVVDIIHMGQYPISFYPGPVRLVLTMIVPVAFITTVPMDALRGMAGIDTVLLTIGFTAVAIALLHWWWNNSVRHYASAGS